MKKLDQTELKHLVMERYKKTETNLSFVYLKQFFRASVWSALEILCKLCYWIYSGQSLTTREL